MSDEREPNEPAEDAWDPEPQAPVDEVEVTEPDAPADEVEVTEPAEVADVAEATEPAEPVGATVARSDDAADEQARAERLAKRVFSVNEPVQRKDGMARAKSAIARSRLAVIPTDTVYGIAADAFDPVGVRRLLRAKGRNRSMPTPVLIGNADTLQALAAKLDPATLELTQEFWPGALTLICRQQPSLRWDLGDNRGTVALRIPDQSDAIDLLNATGPLAVSSANKTGQPPATTVDQAVAMLQESVEVYLDAGPTAGPIPSTILDATGSTLRLVREGVISLQQLREVVPQIEDPETD